MSCKLIIMDIGHWKEGNKRQINKCPHLSLEKIITCPSLPGTVPLAKLTHLMRNLLGIIAECCTTACFIDSLRLSLLIFIYQFYLYEFDFTKDLASDTLVSQGPRLRCILSSLVCNLLKALGGKRERTQYNSKLPLSPSARPADSPLNTEAQVC